VPRVRLLFLGFAAIASPVIAQLTPAQRDLNIKSFEYVWKTVHDKHWEAKPGGLDWNAVHDELRPAIEKANSMAAARAVMSGMLDRLHQTHFGIVPADLYSDIEGSTGQGDITTGIDVRVVGSDVLVTTIETGSSAAAQGVRRGWKMVKIGDTDLDPIVAKINKTYEKSTLRELVSRRSILGRLEGKTGESVRVEFVDGKNQRVVKALTQAVPKGTLTQFGYLTPQHVWFESSKIAGGKIGYVSFNIFLDPARLMNLFADSVQSCTDCSGIVIDLRGNPGGLGAMAMGMAGWFIDKPDQLLGTLMMRETKLKFIINPRANTFAGPVAILMDGASASTSEILAGGMQDLGRARIFGTHSAAAALPSMFEKLPNGDGFQYAMADYISEGGKRLEGLGVTWKLR
jgi:carboxyl-terminal processing protease